jgi:hypothetical protein
MAFANSKHTVAIFEGKVLKYCIGVFDTKDQAEKWAIENHWQQMYKIVELVP